MTNPGPRPNATPPPRPCVPVSGVILAAGTGSRLGRTKPLLDVDGQPLVRRIAVEALASQLTEVVVVVGHDAEAVTRALDGLPVRVVGNPEFQGGQATSVRAGVAAVTPATAGAMFLVCDQPDLRREHIDHLLDAFMARGGGIVVPSAGGRRGSPVTFSRSYFAELSRLTGDTGGRQVVAAHPDDTVVIDLESEAPLADLDTPADVEQWRLRRARPTPQS